MQSRNHKWKSKSYKESEDLPCPICSKKTLTQVVVLIYRKQVVDRFDSAIVAQNYAFEHNCVPATLKYVDHCKNCTYEYTKLERFFTE